MPEPLMLVGAVVHHKVYQQLYPTLFTLCGKLLEILHRAVLLVDGVIVLYAVLVVGIRRHYRRKPDTVESHILNVVQPGGHSGKVADSVPVAVAEGINEHLVVIAVVVVDYIQLMVILISRSLRL